MILNPNPQSVCEAVPLLVALRKSSVKPSVLFRSNCGFFDPVLSDRACMGVMRMEYRVLRGYLSTVPFAAYMVG